MEPWGRVVVLSIGGALGVNARYWLGVWFSRWADPRFPWATFTINVTGSFAIGFLTVLLARWLPQQNARLLVVTGFLGGYTTFSAFAHESLMLWESGSVGRAASYTLGSVATAVLAVILGTILARGLTAPRAMEPHDVPTVVEGPAAK